MAHHKLRSLALVLLAVCAYAVWAAPSFVGFSASKQGATTGLQAIVRAQDKLIPGQLLQVNPEDTVESTSSLRFCGALVSMLAALVVAFAAMAEAQAAKAGGRIGGTAPSMKSKPAPAPPKSDTTVVNKSVVVNKTTVVQPPPPAPVAPAPVAGMPAPSPGPSMGEIAVGSMVGNVVGNVVGNAIGGAMGGGNGGSSTSTDRMLENQQRQDEHQLDRQAAELEDLKRDMMELKVAKP